MSQPRPRRRTDFRPSATSASDQAVATTDPAHKIQPDHLLPSRASDQLATMEL